MKFARLALMTAALVASTVLVATQSHAATTAAPSFPHHPITLHTAGPTRAGFFYSPALLNPIRCRSVFTSIALSLFNMLDSIKTHVP